MADHVVRDGGARMLRVLLGVLAGIATCAVTVLAAVLSFELNPIGPALAAFGAIIGGLMAARRTQDAVLKGLALGLVVGGFVAILLWPVFGVDGEAGVGISVGG
jgi:hypothetical protein